jgi:vanillate O-demethylase ferredoxin subunit
MDWVLGSGREAGLTEHQIHCEYFNAEVDTAGEAFEVVAAQCGVTVQVAGDQTIAQALKAAGVKVEMSCEQGVCGSCICDVLEGLPDHRDHFLSEEEKEDNDQIAPCCSRAKTQRLVLDI